MKTKLKQLILSWGLLVASVTASAQTTLECDFTDPKMARKTMLYHWNVYNVIAPVEKLRYKEGPYEYVNIVRPLGGKVERGSRNKIVEDDTYKWDGEKYYYDWAPLKKQLDNVLERTKIHQLVLDNPSWAFQRGLGLEGKQEVDTYGNPWAPNDPEAWATYIRAMLNELIKTYGRERVGQWRYCVGREIGTPGHWQAGEQAFFDHYKNTEKVVREVLPEAEVGTHLLWASHKHSYGQNFLPWCKENGAKYDFLAISFYPKYQRKDRVDMDVFYERDIAPLIESPDWNPEATFEIHEYAVIEDMVNHRAIRAPELHRNVFTLMLAKLVYEKNLHDVFVWADAPVYAETLKLLKGLEGHTYYESRKKGEPGEEGDMIDAIFSSDKDTQLYEMTAYNYNANDKAKGDEPLILRAKVPAAANAKFRYRIGRFGEDTMKVTWSDWKAGATKAINNSQSSLLVFRDSIESFSYLKYEIVME